LLVGFGLHLNCVSVWNNFDNRGLAKCWLHSHKYLDCIVVICCTTAKMLENDSRVQIPLATEPILRSSNSSAGVVQ
jgi:hypothetical protein